jgi:hypothetical protein
MSSEWLSESKPGYIGFDMFVGGHEDVVRYERRISTEIGQSCLKLLNENWPGLEEWDKNPNNYVGHIIPYRAPYANEGVSWYKFDLPTDEVLKEFGWTKHQMQLAWGGANLLQSGGIGWYGLKLDLVTKDYCMKIPMAYNEYTRQLVKEDRHAPDWYKHGNMYFGQTYYRDETTYKNMARHFEKIGLEVPMTGNRENQKLWGAVYNRDTEKWEVAKAYEKVFSRIK